MSYADSSGMPELVTAPFDVDDVKKIFRYQTEGKFHPYTCCDHQTMLVDKNGLKCPKCGVVQNWVGRSTLELMRYSTNE